MAKHSVHSRPENLPFGQDILLGHKALAQASLRLWDAITSCSGADAITSCSGAARSRRFGTGRLCCEGWGIMSVREWTSESGHRGPVSMLRRQRKVTRHRFHTGWLRKKSTGSPPYCRCIHGRACWPPLRSVIRRNVTEDYHRNILRYTAIRPTCARCGSCRPAPSRDEQLIILLVVTYCTRKGLVKRVPVLREAGDR